jgi:hypothetical protein
MKDKVHKLEVLEDGFNCINDIDKKIYGVLGNHDAATCKILDEQLKGRWNNIHMPSNCYSEVINNNGLKIKIVVIDTNNFGTEYKDLESKNKPTCNKIHEDSFYDYTKMAKFINDELVDDNTRYDWILLCGHIPIAGFKDKKGKKSIRIDDRHYELIRKSILQSPNKDKIIYLCADIHNYQYNIIKFKEGHDLPEIIAGTGGAPPDYFLDKKMFLTPQEITMDNGDKLINEDSHHSFGFGELELTKNYYKPTFVYTGNKEYENVFKATGEKTFAYKQKYLKYPMHKFSYDKYYQKYLKYPMHKFSDDKYYQKYLKYKQKYINLKNKLNF